MSRMAAACRCTGRRHSLGAAPSGRRVQRPVPSAPWLRWRPSPLPRSCLYRAAQRLELLARPRQRRDQRVDRGVGAVLKELGERTIRIRAEDQSRPGVQRSFDRLHRGDGVARRSSRRTPPRIAACCSAADAEDRDRQRGCLRRRRRDSHARRVHRWRARRPAAASAGRRARW